MPIYEYRCADCGRLTTVVTLSVRAAVEPACRHCHGRKMTKIVSRVSVRRSEGNRLEGLAGEGFDKDVDEALEEAERAKESGREGLDGDDGEDL